MLSAPKPVQIVMPSAKLFAAPDAARNVIAETDVHAVIGFVPGGREGSARAGALPTRELGAIKTGVARRKPRG